MGAGSEALSLMPGTRSTGHSLADVDEIVDTHYMGAKAELAAQAIRQLERSVQRPTERQLLVEAEFADRSKSVNDLSGINRKPCPRYGQLKWLVSPAGFEPATY